MVVGTRQAPARARHYRKRKYLGKFISLLVCAAVLRCVYGAASANDTVPKQNVYADLWEAEHETEERTGADIQTASDADIAFTYALYSDMVGGTHAAGTGDSPQKVADNGDGDTQSALEALRLYSGSSASALGDVHIDNFTSKTIDTGEIMTHLATMERSADGPLVLIVHTHASEAYTPSGNDIYEVSDTWRTEDCRYNVVRVGDEIAAVLEAAGISTLHDTTLHDYPSYTGSYGRSMATVEKYLKEYPSIQVVLDVHRDAVELADGTTFATSATLPDGSRCAQAMLVVGTNDTGLEHPNWEKNLAFAIKLQQTMLGGNAGFARNINLSVNRYNQHLTPFSLIVEVGSSGNTLEEALKCARVFACAVAGTIGEM